MRQFTQRRTAQSFTFRPGVRQSRLYSFRDQRSLKLGNRSDHLENEFATGEARVD